MAYRRADWNYGDLAWVTTRRTARQVRILTQSVEHGDVWFGGNGYVLASDAADNIREIERAVAVTEDQHNIIETVEYTRANTPATGDNPRSTLLEVPDERAPDRPLRVGDRVRVTDARTSIGRHPIGSGLSEFVGKTATVTRISRSHHYLDFDDTTYDGTWSRPALDLIVRAPITTTGEERRQMTVREAYPIGSIWQHYNVREPFTVTGWHRSTRNRGTGDNRVEGKLSGEQTDWYRGSMDLDSTEFVGWDETITS